ncbi:DUF6247 family protein [Streptomyces olivoverticillatus]|uniref:DUF6247 family protein n=1 Tax=Streptomyces olivoverticillatus TaxID=66427 RepID=UPI001C87768C|nr:DUF6247 family protein [Streptomyces olivoverticillatus]
MNNTAAGTGGPPTPLPQPASTPEELRAALALLAPDALPTFDSERAVALQQARETVNSAPLRRFVGQWAVYIAIERHPERAARLRELETRAAECEDLDEARSIVAEIGRILDAACAEAGVQREDHAPHER